MPYWSPLLPFGVKSSRGKSLNKSFLPAYEIVYPKSDGLPNFWLPTEDLSSISQTPQKSLNRKVILYFHGGGFIMGGRGSHRMVSHDLCKSTGATVILIEYKRAPEFKHPVAEIECFESYKWLIQRVDSSNIILAGDSAGGALVVNVLSLIKENQISYPRGAVLLSPWVDWFDFTSESMKTNVCFDYIEPTAAKLTAKLYVETPVNYHSPTNKDFVGFPPLLVEYGECEILHDQIKVFIDKATAAGVNVQSNCYPDMIHVFQVFNLTVSLGWSIVRRFLSEKEWRMLSFTIAFYFIIGLGNAVCLDQNSTSCASLNLVTYILRTLVFLAIIVAMNFTVTQLKAMVIQSPWTPSIQIQYIQTRQYMFFRIAFIVYILAPTIIYLVQSSLFSWKESWVPTVLNDLILILMYFQMGVNFSPIHEDLVLGAFDGTYDTHVD
eukprot:gene16892-22381_t